MSFATPRSSRSTDYGWRPPTTMVDVLFLILAFFLTLAAFREDERRMSVALPAVESEQALSGGHTQIVITVGEDGALYMADQAYALPELKQKLAALAAQYPGESVIIRGDKGSRLGIAVNVMDAAYAVGLRSVYLATTKAAGEL